MATRSRQNANFGLAVEVTTLTRPKSAEALYPLLVARSKRLQKVTSHLIFKFKIILLAVREAEPGVCKSLFWGTTELIIQIRKSDTQPFFLGKNKSLLASPSPKNLDSPFLSREPPLLRPSLPRVTVKGKDTLDVGCVTAMYTDEQLTEQVYTLRGHCEACKGKFPTKKMAEHSQCKFIAIKTLFKIIMSLDFYTTCVADRVKKIKRS